MTETMSTHHHRTPGRAEAWDASVSWALGKFFFFFHFFFLLCSQFSLELDHMQTRKMNSHPFCHSQCWHRCKWRVKGRGSRQAHRTFFYYYFFLSNHYLQFNYEWSPPHTLTHGNGSSSSSKAAGAWALAKFFFFFLFFFFGSTNNFFTVRHYDSDDEHAPPNTWMNRGAWDASVSQASGKYFFLPFHFFALLTIFLYN